MQLKTSLSSLFCCPGRVEWQLFCSVRQWALRTPRYNTIGLNKTSLAPWSTTRSLLGQCVSTDPLWPGELYNESDSILYEPLTCNLRRFSWWQARACLSNKHIFFAGDSITRYQYLSLSYLLSRLEYPQQFGGHKSSPSICIEEDWPSWDSFFDGGSALLSAARGAVATEKVDGDHAALHENRMFRLSNMAGEPADAKIEVSCQLVTHDAADALVELLATFQQHPGNLSVPDVIVLNTGLWGLVDVDSIYRQGQEFLVERDSRTRLIWKTTTSASNPTDNDEHHVFPQRERAAFFGNQSLWGQLDAFAMSEAILTSGLDLYWDGLHFLPVGLEIFNDVLLNTLC